MGRMLAPTSLGMLIAQLLVQAPLLTSELAPTKLSAFGTAPVLNPAASSLVNIVARLAAISSNVDVLNDTITLWAPYLGNNASAVVLGVNATSVAPGSPLPIPGPPPGPGPEWAWLALLLLLGVIVAGAYIVWSELSRRKRAAAKDAWYAVADAGGSIGAAPAQEAAAEAAAEGGALHEVKEIFSARKPRVRERKDAAEVGVPLPGEVFSPPRLRLSVDGLVAQGGGREEEPATPVRRAALPLSPPRTRFVS